MSLVKIVSRNPCVQEFIVDNSNGDNKGGTHVDGKFLVGELQTKKYMEEVVSVGISNLIGDE